MNLTKAIKDSIIYGELDGHENVFVKVKVARDKHVVIAIQGVIALVMAAVHPNLIEVNLKENAYNYNIFNDLSVS